MALNTARGEVAVEIGGEKFTLCLTLGALAEIEAACGITTIGELQDAMQKLSAAKLVTILGALIRGGGGTIDESTLYRLPFGPSVSSAITKAFEACGFASAEGASEGKAQAGT